MPSAPAKRPQEGFKGYIRVRIDRGGLRGIRGVLTPQIWLQSQQGVVDEAEEAALLKFSTPHIKGFALRKGGARSTK